MQQRQIPHDHGQLILLNGVAPAVNTNPVIAVPSNYRWRIIAVTATLTSDANAANRTAYLRLIVGVSARAFWFHTRTQPANRSDGWIWATQGSPNSSGLNIFHAASIPEHLLMSDVCSLDIATDNFQAGDQWGAISVFVERWRSTI